MQKKGPIEDPINIYLFDFYIYLQYCIFVYLDFTELLSHDHDQLYI